jgi:hypothetical protein
MATRLAAELICACLVDLPARRLLAGPQHAVGRQYAVQRGHAVLRRRGVARRHGVGLQNAALAPRALGRQNAAADVAQPSANAAWARPSWQCVARLPRAVPSAQLKVASSVVQDAVAALRAGRLWQRAVQLPPAR